MEKLRREQTVRKRREDKLQRKAEARAAKTDGSTDTTPSEAIPDADDGSFGSVVGCYGGDNEERVRSARCAFLTRSPAVREVFSLWQPEP